MPFTQLPPELQRAVNAAGFTTPLPVQRVAIPQLKKGHNAFIHSRTGSGKTLAYLLPLLADIHPEERHTQALLVAPTHELALQIRDTAKDLVQKAGWSITCLSLLGGTDISRQKDALKKHPHLVVGSAGRMMQLVQMRKLKLEHLRWLVFDEADRLFDENTLKELLEFHKQAPAQARRIFVSATQSAQSLKIARGMAPDLELLEAQTESNSAVRHFWLGCEEREKPEWLRKAIHALKVRKALVFVHRAERARELCQYLSFHKISVADLHGAQDKFARQEAMRAFRKGQAPVLVASDIAARGLDITNIDLVVNFDAPSQNTEYLHRAGRTGRANAAGIVLTLLTPQQYRLAARYAQALDLAVEEMRIKGGVWGAKPIAPQQKSGPRKHNY